MKYRKIQNNDVYTGNVVYTNNPGFDVGIIVCITKTSKTIGIKWVKPPPDYILSNDGLDYNHSHSSHLYVFCAGDKEEK